MAFDHGCPSVGKVKTAVLVAGLLLAAQSGASTERVVPILDAPRIALEGIEPDHASLEIVTVPMVFPVAGKVEWEDTFLASRGSRRHFGQDLMAEKMTPLVACFDGWVTLHKAKAAGGHNWLELHGLNAWRACYLHINNDTPGTDDGLGSDAYAFAPGLKDRDYVRAGQFIAYVGDSGNAEDVAPHCHFELWDSMARAVVNAGPSLLAAEHVELPHRP